MSAVDGISALENFKLQPVDAFISTLVAPPPGSSLSTIVALLKERNVNEVFLPEGNRCGIISVRHLLRLGTIENAKSSSVMTHVPTLTNQATVGQAGRLMVDYGLNAIPIADERKVMGQVSRLRLLNELRGKIGTEIRITSIATESPATVEMTTSLATVRDLMIRKKVDHIPVLDERRASGLITSTHIISRMTPPERVGNKSMVHEIKRALDFPASDFMDRNPLTCSPQTSAHAALESMFSNSQTCILITQWDELQSIATRRDFTKLLVETEPKFEVPVSIIGLPEDPFEAEAAKAKFIRTINQLQRIFPDILEAKSVIKSKFSRPGKERGRYEVTVHITSSKKSYSYSEAGWDLPAVYDLITDKLKRLMSQKKRRTPREREQAEVI